MLHVPYVHQLQLIYLHHTGRVMPTSHAYYPHLLAAAIRRVLLLTSVKEDCAVLIIIITKALRASAVLIKESQLIVQLCLWSLWSLYLE